MKFGCAQGTLPSLDVQGKESGTRPWELLDSDRWLRVRDPRVGSRGSPGKTGRHGSSGHGTVQGRARWTPKRQI
ncbi:hypothetical protein CRG98_006434 [Punica granatum]|uniref:Uncharacterized protein n=1 Tax=Punica granatum TaxID=22663 RepID=A0A2I0KXJ6_PUNGR|nr:hypothetical protein CRG98_006434 [Punica granatum]